MPTTRPELAKFLLSALIALLLLATLIARTQTNPALATSSNSTASLSPQTNSSAAAIELREEIRSQCLAGRRRICGRILQVLPTGLVIESGYTNLLREPLGKSWLVPGTATASPATNLIESAEPGGFCVGRVFLTNFPKSRSAKPAPYDYVIIEAYPAGHFTYTSLGTISRTVRRFSANLPKAVDLNLADILGQPEPAGK